MATIFEKIGQHLQVRDKDSGVVLFQAPCHAVLFDSYALANDNEIRLFDTSIKGVQTQRPLTPIPIEGAEDGDGNTFSESTFREFIAWITGFDVALDGDGAFVVDSIDEVDITSNQ